MNSTDRLSMLTLYDGYARAAIAHANEDWYLTIPKCKSKTAAAAFCGPMASFAQERP